MSAVAAVAAGRWLGTAGGSVVRDAGAGVDSAAAAGGSVGAVCAGTGGWPATFVGPLVSVAGSGGVLAPAANTDANVVPMTGVVRDGGVETGAEGPDAVAGGVARAEAGGATEARADARDASDPAAAAPAPTGTGSGLRGSVVAGAFVALGSRASSDLAAALARVLVEGRGAGRMPGRGTATGAVARTTPGGLTGATASGTAVPRRSAARRVANGRAI